MESTGLVLGLVNNLLYVSQHLFFSFNFLHTCKKRVMWRRWLFWPKKLAEKVSKSRQNVNRDKSA